MKSNLSDMFRSGVVWIMPLAMASIVATACSDDDSGFAGGSTEDAGIIANLNVAGLTQKGPFVKGAAVTVQGIDCKTLKFTDELFEGEVKSDKGDFTVEDVSLKSTCALFEVTGVYRNEITGNKSSDELTLHALTDLKDRKNVNINVLTELEYERLMFLVTEKGKKFAEAKARAEKEVLAAFDIKGDFVEFENLNIFESGDENAALLAVSVMMQAETNDAGLVTRMEKFVESFAETGKWKDSGTKKTISEWAIEVTANGGLDSIRKNVEAWDLGDTVPAFEKFIEAYADGDSVVLIVTPKSSSSETSVSSSSRDTTYNAEKNTLTDTRDGKVYRTVTIGNQIWMAENLNYKTDSSFCYNDSAEYCAKYGRLYIWDAAMDACPDGWHLPDSTEWNTLFSAVGGKSTAEEVLKSTSGWVGEKGEARNGTDNYGFAALPAGVRDERGGLFSREGGTAKFWSSTERSSDMATNIILYYYFDVFEASGRHDAMSVRCLNDDTAVPPSSSSSKPVETSSSSGNSSSSEFKRVLCNVDTDKNCFKDERDGQTYRMVKIGNQVWMAENMNYETAGSYCYNDYAENCKNYGRLYTWGAAMDSAGVWSTDGKGCGRHILDGDGFVCSATFPVRGVCPEGWHLPDTTEWYILFAAVGGQSSSGKALKSTSGWDKWDDNGNGEDTYGFSGLPAGASNYDMFQFALFWSSVEHYTGGYNIDAYGMSLYYKSAVASLYREPKSAQFSVRCLKNDDGTVPKSSSSSADEVNCSALLEEERKNGAWSWDVPKECRFNPDIDYGSMTDERDGKVYRTVKIGNQVWMAENLNYYDSTNLNIKETSWCYGKSDNKDSSTCDVTGRLYTWAAAITVCPSDWRLPSDADWDSLFSVVGGRSGGRNLKSLTGWYGDGGGTDSFGFSAIPGGHKSDGGAFFSVGIYAYFWSSTEREDGKVRGMSLYYSYDDMTPYIIDKYIAYSVRCVKG